ncbi:MAG: corrinoid protein [Candidatus Xenobiia bacterium LiM19]
MSQEELFQSMKKSIVEGNVEEARKLAEKSLKEGVDARDSITSGFTPGIEKVGELWEEGEYFLPELVVASDAMKAALSILEPTLSSGRGEHMRGTIVIGTVEGDIHDIGKSLVGAIMAANGFHVIDLGVDVPVQRFVDKAKESGAQAIGLSALLTTTMINQKRVIEILEKEGIRKSVKVLVGGAPVSKEWAQRIGADDAPGDAFEAVSSLIKLLAEGVRA